MPKWITACFALFLSLTVFSTQAQSVDDIIDAFVRAGGGKEKLAGMPLVDYAAHGHMATLLGTEKMRGRQCYKVQLMLSGGGEIIYFIDPVTWFIIWEIRKKEAIAGEA